MSSPSSPSTILSTIHAPADLRNISRADLKTVADELREHVLQSVSKTGGHLSSNLGTVS
jgi:1-deoxy-D-xylulose-5-phosphate synthase